MSSICIDVGATKTEMALLESGKLAGKIAFPTPEKLESAILLCAKKAKGLRFSRACMALAGSTQNGVVFGMPNIKCNAGFNAKTAAEKIFRKPVFVENDVKCAALAEAKYGAAKKMGGKGAASGIAVFVWPGSGIGGAILSGGKLLRGASNCAGEFGHMKIEFGKNARKCGCGFRGCFEAYCGGKGIEKAYYAKFKTKKSAREIFLSKSPADVAFAKNASYLFGLGLASIASALNPPLIIIGGSLARSYMGKFRKTVLASFMANATPPASMAKIAKSRLENAVLAGAALAAGV